MGDVGRRPGTEGKHGVGKKTTKRKDLCFPFCSRFHLHPFAFRITCAYIPLSSQVMPSFMLY